MVTDKLRLTFVFIPSHWGAGALSRKFCKVSKTIKSLTLTSCYVFWQADWHTNIVFVLRFRQYFLCGVFPSIFSGKVYCTFPALVFIWHLHCMAVNIPRSSNTLIQIWVLHEALCWLKFYFCFEIWKTVFQLELNSARRQSFAGKLRSGTMRSPNKGHAMLMEWNLLFYFCIVIPYCKQIFPIRV